MAEHQQRPGFMPEKGPSTSQVLAVITLFPVGGILLVLSGLTLAGTLIGLTVATPTFRDLQPNPGPRSSGSRTGYHRISHLRRLRNHRTVFTLLDRQLPPERPRNGANGACKVESAGGCGPVGHEGEGSWAWNPRQGTRNYKDMNNQA
ncbi:hypothetical protein CK203_006421 [Vitis vinifera]|uniref:Oleosin n=1 Tax=Vitis vinifera TaxID=29760 RepID=A0A438KAT9_VITVI|nr:hypothetical protein CK203_006421 [Vitis vinifera]